jgi:mitochondrial fission protein ELM1
VVTGESVSMVSEACASGRPVIVIEPPRAAGRVGAVKQRRFLDELVRAGAVEEAALSGLDAAIRRALSRPASSAGEDAHESLRTALGRVLA